MSDACSDPDRKLPTHTKRPPSSQGSDSSWTSTVEASPESFSDSEPLSELDAEESLDGEKTVTKVEQSVEPLDIGHPVENDPMVARNALADQLQPKKKGPGRPRKLGNAKPGEPARRNLRVKTGCHTCRKRKKKCDEAKPECESMQRMMDGP